MIGTMFPTHTGHTNGMLGAPEGKMTGNGECMALPVCRVDKRNVYYSFWEPTKEDIAKIVAGAPIRLAVFGFGHPPVAIAATDSIDE